MNNLLSYHYLIRDDRKEREELRKLWKEISARWVEEYQVALKAMRDKGTADG